ncbi:sorting and assembly machinery component 50 homolog B [Selaginella moellendorffii]|nr:sorting and assembly machinery component 50 homolog B [Selaginella moellendorffii]|eukprot:XP_002960275.2 sorting and assembly machinery component 50 homolog B [Selaginella moellendorffii]
MASEDDDARSGGEQNRAAEEDVAEDGAEEEEEEEAADGSNAVRKRRVLERLAHKMEKEDVNVRVHDIQIKGNKRTKDWVIESVLGKMKEATTLQDILLEAAKASVQMERMDVFERWVINFDVGPPELPGTTNVIVEVVEPERPYSCNVGMFSRPESRKWSLEGTLKWKNLLGYGETWDGTGCYGWDSTAENSVGVNFPRFRTWPAGFFTRVSLLSQDWHKYSSYKERLLGVSTGLIHDNNHELSYNLTWRNLADPSHRASKTVRGQLGHSLLSAVKYSYRLDTRDSSVRPTEGFAFSTSSQIAGLGPDARLSRFFRQELDFRFAVPLGVFNAALNLGASAGLIVPWGKDFLSKSTPLSDRFYMGGPSCLVSELRGPFSLVGFRTRGVGPRELRRLVKSGNEEEIGKRDTLGGDFAINGFADLSFDLPLKFLKEHDIHAHVFACSGNILSLADRKNMTAQKFFSGFRSSVGAGLVIPTRMFRLEINYCRVLKYQENDRVRKGFQLCFSPP